MFSQMIRSTALSVTLAFCAVLSLAHAASLEPVTITVPSIAQLRLMAVPDSYIGGLVYVSGYTAGNDDGSGWFKIKSASCTDDNGWKIALQGSHCAWRQGIERGFSVTDFGAVTNNLATDNSAAINYAIAAACTVGAPTKQIYFPKTTAVDGSGNSYYLWNTANPINILCGGLKLSGLGGAQIYFTNASLPACLINSNSSLTTSITMENLSFETSQSASIPYCLWLKGISNSVFRNISFPKEVGAGFKNPIRVESDDTHLSILNSFYDLGIRTYCNAASIGFNSISTATTQANGVTTQRIFSGSIDGCLGWGFKGLGISVFGTVFEENPDICVEFTDPPSVVTDNIGNILVGAYFEGCGTWNIKYNGSHVYWNMDIGSSITGSSQKIYDSTGRNYHGNMPWMNETYSERIVVPNGATTVDVTIGGHFYTANSSPTTITDFTVSGSTCNRAGDFWLHIDGNTTVSDGGHIHNAGSSNVTGQGWYSWACLQGTWQQRTLKSGP